MLQQVRATVDSTPSLMYSSMSAPINMSVIQEGEDLPLRINAVDDERLEIRRSRGRFIVVKILAVRSHTLQEFELTFEPNSTNTWAYTIPAAKLSAGDFEVISTSKMCKGIVEKKCCLVLAVEIVFRLHA